VVHQRNQPQDETLPREAAGCPIGAGLGQPFQGLVRRPFRGRRASRLQSTRPSDLRAPRANVGDPPGRSDDSERQEPKLGCLFLSRCLSFGRFSDQALRFRPGSLEVLSARLPVLGCPRHGGRQRMAVRQPQGRWWPSCALCSTPIGRSRRCSARPERRTLEQRRSLTAVNAGAQVNMVDHLTANVHP
jgi:hypothetical protein